MAIVFISPKQRQRTLLYTIIGIFVLGLIIFGLFIFIIKPRLVPVEQVFSTPKIEINFEVLTSEKLKELQLFEGVKQEFSYQGKTGEGVIESGRITAVSDEAALKILEELGFSEIQIEEMARGRQNFFNFTEIIPPAPEKQK